MKTLSKEDAVRIVAAGERLLLLDLTNASSESAAVHVPFDDDFVRNVLALAEPAALPLVILGKPATIDQVESAAAALRQAGCVEVWTYYETWPNLATGGAVVTQRCSVVSDPDADQGTRQARSLRSAGVLC
ncbi:hypothetical protein AYO47_00310 [Planctomyces sp. SCGC AG-212-M04]|nr:hypothetical protein AYO47_00310 [Planctomyces sp. SCGC AG-212-M04]